MANQFVLANVVTYLLIQILYYYFEAIKAPHPRYFDTGALSYNSNNIYYYDTLYDVNTECLFSSTCNSMAFLGFDIVLKYKAAY